MKAVALNSRIKLAVDNTHRIDTLNRHRCEEAEQASHRAIVAFGGTSFVLRDTWQMRSAILDALHPPDQSYLCNLREKLALFVHSLMLCEEAVFHVHQVVLCPRSNVLASAMGGDEANIISLPEPSEVVSGLLVYLYSGSYGQTMPSDLSCSDWFVFHFRLASMSERFIIQDLCEIALNRMKKTIKSVREGNIYDLILCAKFLYQATPNSEQDSVIVGLGKQILLDKIARRILFRRLRREYPHEDVLRSSRFCWDLLFEVEGILETRTVIRTPQ